MTIGGILEMNNNLRKSLYQRVDETITENVATILGESTDENGISYREVYRYEFERIVKALTKLIEGKYSETNSELAAILKYECLLAFGDTVTLSLSGYEKVIEEIIQSLNTRSIIEWEMEFDTYISSADGFPAGTLRTSKFTREEFLTYANSSTVRLSPTFLQAFKTLS